MTCFQVIATGLGLLLVAAVLSASAGQFSAASVAEGSCRNIESTPLLRNNSLQLFVETTLSATTYAVPVGSAHYYRSLFEWIQCREATSQEELNAAGLQILCVSQNVINWELYNKTADGECLLVSNVARPFDVPNFVCTSFETRTPTVLGIPIKVPVLPRNEMTDSYVLIWASQAGTTLLNYRCSNNKQDWQVWTYGDGTPFDTNLLSEILPIVQSLGFNTSLTMYAT